MSARIYETYSPILSNNYVAIEETKAQDTKGNNRKRRIAQTIHVTSNYALQITKDKNYIYTMMLCRRHSKKAHHTLIYLDHRVVIFTMEINFKLALFRRTIVEI